MDRRVLAEGFRRRVGHLPDVVAVAPGRVEILGNHTDYNEGLVMSAALELGLGVAAAPRADRRVRLFSRRRGGPVLFSIDQIEHDPAARWADYLKGVLRELAAAGVPIVPADVWLNGDLPSGGGMSSSAAFEVSTALAFLQLAGRELDRWTVATLCRRAENEFVGVKCGILDQFSSLFGVAEHLLWLDCRSLDHGAVRLGPGLELVVANTMVRHALADGAYNELRASCERAVAHFQARIGDHPVRALRDVSAGELDEHARGLAPADRRRAQHVVEEIERVDGGREAVAAGDVARLGELMLASHASSRDLFGNSCRELDLMVDLAAGLDGVFGAKLSGGGFGGCIVALVRADRGAEVVRRLAQEYQATTGIEPQLHRCRIGAGARVLP